MRKRNGEIFQLHMSDRIGVIYVNPFAWLCVLLKIVSKTLLYIMYLLLLVRFGIYEACYPTFDLKDGV